MLRKQLTDNQDLLFFFLFMAVSHKHVPSWQRQLFSLLGS